MTIANDNNGGAGKNSVAITQRYYKLYHARSMKAINAFRPTASEDWPAGQCFGYGSHHQLERFELI